MNCWSARRPDSRRPTRNGQAPSRPPDRPARRGSSRPARCCGSLAARRRLGRPAHCRPCQRRRRPRRRRWIRRSAGRRGPGCWRSRCRQRRPSRPLLTSCGLVRAGLDGLADGLPAEAGKRGRAVRAASGPGRRRRVGARAVAGADARGQGSVRSRAPAWRPAGSLEESDHGRRCRHCGAAGG